MNMLENKGTLIAIIGAGGHARVVADCLKRGGVTNLCFIDINASPEVKTIRNLKVYRTQAEIPGAESIVFANGVGSISKESLIRRAEVYASHRSNGCIFPTILDPTASLSQNVQFGDGSQLLMGVCLQDGVEIGENTIINTRASIDHDSRIGNNVHIAPGVTISGGVIVEDLVHIGTGTTIIQGIKIGRGAFIAAGAVVVKDVPENTTFANAKVLHKESVRI